jgi:3-methyladenine DNA glycosylase AlkC
MAPVAARRPPRMRRVALDAAETPERSSLPLVAAVAQEANLPGAMALPEELEAHGFYAVGLVEQWSRIAGHLWELLRDLPDSAGRIAHLAAHPEPRIRFHAASLWAKWGMDRPEDALPELQALADDEDFRVLEAAQAFGLRPFAVHWGPAVRGMVQDWTTHPSPKVRRAVVTALRPRGFWVSHLEWVQEDPALLVPLLESFRDETARFPANAVANAFNDLSHKHPMLVLSVLERWARGDGPLVEHMTRKGLRTLLKKGDVRALALLGMGEVELELAVSLRQGELVPPNTNLCFDLALRAPGEGGEVELVYEIETTGRIAGRPRRKRYQGGRYLVPDEATIELALRERIFDRKAAPLLDGPAAATFFLNGRRAGRVEFAVRRED